MPQRIEVTSAFATRWEEEWSIAQQMAAHHANSADRRAINLFLESYGPEIARELKHYLLEVLLQDAQQAQEKIPSTTQIDA